MKNSKKFAALIMAFATAATLSGCAALNGDEREEIDNEITENVPEINAPDYENPPVGDGNPPAEEEPSPANPPEEVVPQIKTVSYLNVMGSGVNIRSGAGAGYASRGTAQRSTLYAYNGKAGDWYQTGYKNKKAYISANYCELVEMTASEDERIEAVIAEGTKLLGTVYVFGAIRYHSGNGTLLNNFTTDEFDCSSLMQYIFKKGANVNLQMTTRTQIYQGKTVDKSQLKRGDLMFFTNASRKDKVGVERVGHVALYLGDNWILHTASDFAKIEQINATRWGYFIQAQRIF